MSRFETKDSGQRLVFDSGMQRDVTEGKVNYLLTRDGPMYERWAELLQRGAEKYDEGNWMKAQGEAELERFRESALRHFEAWLRGDSDEDHAAAVFFNINGAEYVKERVLDEVETVLWPPRKVETGIDFARLPGIITELKDTPTGVLATYQKPGAAVEAEPVRSTLTLDLDKVGAATKTTLQELTGKYGPLHGAVVEAEPWGRTEGCCGDPADCGCNP